MNKKIVIVAETLTGIYKEDWHTKALLKFRTRPVSNWWYLHGKLEEEVGYDKGLIVSPLYLKSKTYSYIEYKGDIKEYSPHTMYYLEDGIYDVEVVNTDKSCKGYFWTHFEKFGNILGEVPHMTGLVVFADDKEANEYAYKKYCNKSRTL